MAGELEAGLEQLFGRFEPLPQRCARNQRRLRIYLTLYVLLSSLFACAVIVLGAFIVLVFVALRSADLEMLLWGTAIKRLPPIIAIGWLVCIPPFAIWCWRAVHRPERELLDKLFAAPVPVGECQEAKSALHDAVIAAGIPMPRLALISDSSLNAFAIAHSAETAWIGVTQGLLDALSRDELRCVLAHLVARIRDGSAITSTVLAELFSRVSKTWDASEIDLSSWPLTQGGGYSGTNANGAIVVGYELLRSFLGMSSVFILAGYKHAQRVIAESADMEAMLLTRDPEGMLGALRKVLPADNRPGSIWLPRLREDVFGSLFFAWPTFSFSDDEELVRIRRMQEVLGAAGV
ncbi:MAG: M48 family metalloprotease [Coriobacteriia bacterium]